MKENAIKIKKAMNYEGCWDTICTAVVEKVVCLGQDTQTQSNPPQAGLNLECSFSYIGC